MSASRSCNVVCSRCGRSYRVSSRNTIVKLRSGKSIYCPACVPVIQRENMVRVNYERFHSQHEILAAFKDFEYRCRLIGLKPGRLYRINPNSICDRYDNSESLKRIRGY